MRWWTFAVALMVSACWSVDVAGQEETPGAEAQIEVEADGEEEEEESDREPRHLLQIHPSPVQSGHPYSHGWIGVPGQNYPPHPKKTVFVAKQPQYVKHRPLPPQPQYTPHAAPPARHRPRPRPRPPPPLPAGYRPNPPSPPRPSSSPPSRKPRPEEGGEVDDGRPVQPRDYFPPPNIIGLLEDEGATFLLSVLNRTGLLTTLEGKGPFTLFAPTNEAFMRLDLNVINDLNNDDVLLERVLQYHVVPGGKLFSAAIRDDLLASTALQDVSLRLNVANNVTTVGGAEVVKPDQRASNGIVHFLADLIYPLPEGSLFDTLEADNRFITLVRALEIAGLDNLIGDDQAGPWTVLAPTDEAFDSIPLDDLNDLLDDPVQLTKVLEKHLITGTKLSPALSYTTVKTLAGDELTVRTRKGRVLVGPATLLDGDILATNGVVQVIDRVLL